MRDYERFAAAIGMAGDGRICLGLLPRIAANF